MILKRSTLTLVTLNAVLFAAFITDHARAQTPVPSGLSPLQTSQLTKRFEELVVLRDAINVKVDHLESTCKGIKKGTYDEVRCIQEQKVIRDDKAAWEKLRKPYEHDLSAAIIAARIIAPGPVVADLGKDPALAETSKLRLDQINGRLARIDKAIRVLSDENPDWAKQHKILYDEYIEETDELFWNGLDLMTFGFAELAKLQAKIEYEAAKALLDGHRLSELKTHRAWLVHIQRNGPPNEGFNKIISDIDRFEKAVVTKNAKDAEAQLREMISFDREVYNELKKDPSRSDQVAKGFRRVSLEIAGLGVSHLFMDKLSVPAYKLALGAGALAKLTEAGLRLKLVIEEDQQLRTFAAESAARNAKKRELMETKADLERQARDLQLVILRSQGLK